MATNRPTINSLIAISLTIFSLILITHQAYLPAYRAHLQTDITTFQQRANYFLQHHTWKNIGFNEHQPGTLWLFVALGSLTSNPQNFDAYLTTVTLTNLALLITLVYIFHRFGPPHSTTIFSLLLIASGPILLYRFEAIVGLLTLLAWILFQQKRSLPSATLLGLATATKVYPIILLPPLLIPPLRQRNYRQTIHIITTYGIGLTIPILTVLATGSSLPEMKRAMDFHSQKPITTEGIIGQGVMALQKISHTPLRITPKNNIHGFTSDLPLVTNNLLNYAWIPPLLLLYFWFWRQPNLNPTNPAIAFVTLLIFVIFTKVLNAQYLWWPLFFLPLISIQKMSRQTAIVLITSTLLMLALTTYVFPLHYSEYLDWLNGQGANNNLFTITVIRNLLLLGITTLALLQLKTPTAPKTT